MRYRYLRFPENKPKAVTFSYDDACRTDIKLCEILNKYGLKGTFNVISGWIGVNDNDWHLTKEEIKQHIISKGHEIALHGQNHRANGVLMPIEGIQDVINCRLQLEKYFDLIIRGMAYPDSGINRFSNGNNYENVKNYLKELNIAYSRTTKSHSGFELPEDWLAWHPTTHHDNPNIIKLIEDFLSLDFSKIQYISAMQPRLFYIWGHSYEFDRNDNWEHLEEICKKISSKDDIWYATNIEICKYVEAYNSLEFSADCSKVFNPTIYKIWFVVDGKDYCVESGETIRIC